MGLTAMHEDAGIFFTPTGSSKVSRRRKLYSNNPGDYHTNDVCLFRGLQRIRQISILNKCILIQNIFLILSSVHSLSKCSRSNISTQIFIVCAIFVSLCQNDKNVATNINIRLDESIMLKGEFRLDRLSNGLTFCFNFVLIFLKEPNPINFFPAQTSRSKLNSNVFHCFPICLVNVFFQGIIFFCLQCFVRSLIALNLYSSCIYFLKEEKQKYSTKRGKNQSTDFCSQSNMLLSYFKSYQNQFHYSCCFKHKTFTCCF